MWFNASIAMLAMVLALLARPWRAVPNGHLPWPWLAWWATMPVWWCADTLLHQTTVQPVSGVCLLMLMAGWPLAMLALGPVAFIAAALGGLDWSEAMSRWVWLGVVPGTLAMLLGAGVRRWLPNHLFVYILGRGFFASLLAMALSGWLALAWFGAPQGTMPADLAVGRWLGAWGEAFMTGMLVAIFVALRPEWLATYSDRIYLPRP